MSFFLSRKIDLGFEFDLLDFFLQILTVELMKINLMLSIIATTFCYSPMILRLKFDSWNEIGTLRMEVDDIPNFVVKERVVRTIDEEIIVTIYTHNHCKPKNSKKRNSLSEYLYFYLQITSLMTCQINHLPLTVLNIWILMQYHFQL
ncbi:hypothetical protein MTR_5g074080 [Medicago truncatula]|uniref:Uncharacterized protein n=1 Tax=Medicago truncatula TaxID=3880 RepID=G7K5Q7_MEDTR|nr:hypothetical protein MTR_5g074080 [Medicago truncatula]